MNRLYYKKLSDWVTDGHKKPLMLRSVRQCGKTYLLEQFGKNEFPSFHYFNFEAQPELINIFESNLNPTHLINELSFYYLTNR